MASVSNYLDDPNTHRLATRCCACGTALRDAKSVELGIGPVCRKKAAFSGIYDGLSEVGRIAANGLVHRCGRACETGDFKTLLETASDIEDLGFAGVADKVRTRFLAVRFEYAEGVTEYGWTPAKGEFDTGRTHDILRVFPKYNPRFNSLRKERRLRGRPVKCQERGFYWEFPVRLTRDVYKLVQDTFHGQIGLGSKGHFLIERTTK